MIKVIATIFILVFMLVFGASSLIKYMKTNKIERTGWDGFFIFFFFFFLSPFFAPLIIARKLTDEMDYKELHDLIFKNDNDNEPTDNNE